MTHNIDWPVKSPGLNPINNLFFFLVEVLKYVPLGKYGKNVNNNGIIHSVSINVHKGVFQLN